LPPFIVQEKRKEEKRKEEKWKEERHPSPGPLHLAGGMLYALGVIVFVEF